MKKNLALWLLLPLLLCLASCAKQQETAGTAMDQKLQRDGGRI